MGRSVEYETKKSNLLQTVWQKLRLLHGGSCSGHGPRRDRPGLIVFRFLCGVCENLRATQIMLEKLETIRLYTWEQINGSNSYVIPRTFTNYYQESATTHSGLAYTGALTIAPCPLPVSYSSEMRLITVSITWPSSHRLQSKQMQTMVARLGLQNYVY
jgi:hypothetical protein